MPSGEYRHVNPRRKVSIPRQRSPREIEEAIPLMPLRIKLVKLKPIPPGDSVEDGGRRCGIAGCKRDWTVTSQDQFKQVKRPKSARGLFAVSIRKQVKADNPKLGRKELTQLIHRRWEEAKGEEKTTKDSVRKEACTG